MLKKIEDYDFYIFKNKRMQDWMEEGVDIDIYYEYVVEKFKNKRMWRLVSLLTCRDRSVESYDVAVTIALKLREKAHKDKEYIPTSQHIYRLLLDILKRNKFLYNEININEYKDNEWSMVGNEYDYMLLLVDIKKLLTVKEFYVLEMYLAKYTYKDIGEYLKCSATYANKLVNNIFKKIKVDLYGKQ